MNTNDFSKRARRTDAARHINRKDAARHVSTSVKILAVCIALAGLMLPMTATAQVTGTMDIGGTTGVSLATDQSGTGWTWTANTATLTLSTGYGGSPIAINCASGETVNLVYTGDVTVESNIATASALTCAGSLNISESGSNGTLTLNYTGGGSGFFGALTVYGNLTVAGGTVVATCNSNTSAAAAIYGSMGVTISGSANVSATVTGTDASGIMANMGGSVTISTTGTVSANGTGYDGYAINTLVSSGNISISGGTVTLSHDYPTRLYLGVLNHTGGTVNGDSQGTITYPNALLNTGLFIGSSTFYNFVAPSNASNNLVTVNNTFSTTDPDHVFGGYNNTGASTGNTTTLNSGATVNISVFGGFATGAGDATNNTVTINSGATVNVSVYGGYTDDAGSSSENTVIVKTGATVNGGVYGGYLSSNVGNTADNNTVTLHSGVAVGIDVYGGCRLFDPIGTGNKLELIGSGQSVGGDLKGFQQLSFSLPSTLSNGGTILTVGGTADITGATVSIDGSGLSFSVGDTVVLIAATGAGTLIGAPANTTVSGGGYNWSLSVSGNKLIATVYVSAQTPDITVQPQPAYSYEYGTPTPLTVTASVSDNGTLSYQWYRNTTDSNTGGTPIPGATDATYTPPTDMVGTTYYYVVVTSVNGSQTTTVTSRTVEVTVSEPPTPVISRRVTLDVSPHFASDPAPGISYVESTRNLEITLTPLATLPEGYEPEVTTNRTSIPDDQGGVKVTRNDDGTYTVLIACVQQNITVTVTAVSPVATNEHIAGARVWSYGNRLYIAATQPGEAYIYNVTGVLVKILPYAAGETVGATLPAGVYVVALEGRRYKVAVK